MYIGRLWAALQLVLITAGLVTAGLITAGHTFGKDWVVCHTFGENWVV